MNINKNIVMQLLSVMGCEIKGFKNEQNVMGLAIYKNGKIGEFTDDGVKLKVNSRMLNLKYDKYEYTTFVTLLNQNKLG